MTRMNVDFFLLLIFFDQIVLSCVELVATCKCGKLFLQNNGDDEDELVGRSRFFYWRKYRSRRWWHLKNLLHKDTNRKWPDVRGSGPLRFLVLLLMWLALWPVFLLFIVLMGLFVFGLTLLVEIISPGGLGPRRKPPTVMQLAHVSIATAVSMFETCFWNCMWTCTANCFLCK